ncbi:hypothetical protein D9M68_925240 [compost metagenome]
MKYSAIVNSGKPSEPRVGTPGSSGEADRPVVARMRILPLLCMGMRLGSVVTSRGRTPPMVSVSASEPPL